MYSIVAVRKENGQISQLKLDSGSIITQDDLEKFISLGAEFQTVAADGSTAKVMAVVVEGKTHLRTERNQNLSDNLSNLPTF